MFNPSKGIKQFPKYGLGAHFKAFVQVSHDYSKPKAINFPNFMRLYMLQIKEQAGSENSEISENMYFCQILAAYWDLKDLIYA